MRVASVLRSVEVQPLFRDLCKAQHEHNLLQHLPILSLPYKVVFAATLLHCCAITHVTYAVPHVPKNGCVKLATTPPWNPQERHCPVLGVVQ